MCEGNTGALVAIREILDRIAKLETNGSIKNGDLAESLRAILREATVAFADGDDGAAVRSLARFIDCVERRAPLHITEQAARSLIERIVWVGWRAGDHDVFQMYV